MAAVVLGSHEGGWHRLRASVYASAGSGGSSVARRAVRWGRRDPLHGRPRASVRVAPDGDLLPHRCVGAGGVGARDRPALADAASTDRRRAAERCSARGVGRAPHGRHPLRSCRRSPPPRRRNRRHVRDPRSRPRRRGRRHLRPRPEPQSADREPRRDHERARCRSAVRVRPRDLVAHVGHCRRRPHP